MARKKFFLVVDTETTQTDQVADFGAVICDKQGNIHKEIGVLTEFYNQRDKHPLFHQGDFLGGKANLGRRYNAYDEMLKRGDRSLAYCSAINKWLARANAQYRPILTAYNLAFDKNKCLNSGIDLSMFSQSFCLWYAAAQKWGNSRGYLQFCLDNHFFGNKTKTGHMGMQTKADCVAKYLFPHLPDEPHTALEDARDYEVPILAALVKTTSPKVYMNPEPYNYRNYALRDLFKPK